MKRWLCLQCQDLPSITFPQPSIFCGLSKGVTDRLSVLGCVLGLSYHAGILQPQTETCSCWGMEMGCPNPGAGAAALQGPCELGVLLPPGRSFPSRGTSAAAGALQRVPASSLADSVSQVLQLLWGRKVSLPLGPGAFFELYLYKTSTTKACFPEAD